MSASVAMAGMPGIAGERMATSNKPATVGSTRVMILNPLEHGDWDSLLPGGRSATAFHTSAWAQVLCETYGHEPLYLGLGEGGRFEALLPLMEVASRLTGRRGVSLPFTDACAPLQNSPGAAALLYQNAAELGRERGWRYLECRFQSPEWGGAVPSVSFAGHELNLARTEEELLKGMGGSTRNAMRKAERVGLRLDFSADAGAMDRFYELHCQTRRRHGVPPQPKRFFDNIARFMLRRGKGFVVSAYHEGTAIAAAVFLHHEKHAVYKFGASDMKHQAMRPNDLLMWGAIRHLAGQGFAVLDFGRSSLANEGLRRFKSGFGSTETRLDYCRYDFRSGAFCTDTDRADSWVNRVFSRLPVPMLRWIGSNLYPHMS